MTDCLGMYIEDNLIKYAKVSKSKDKIKIESFGIKFYENLQKGIEQVIQETYSQKTPICINLAEEMYTYFDMFSLLSKNDLQKAIKTEFESYCNEKDYNINAFETRYAICKNAMDKDKIGVIHIAENKMELNKRYQQFQDYRLTGVYPLSMSITNVVNNAKEKNYLIVNIENNTTITTVINNNVYNIEKIEQGSYDILSKINLKENSYSKAYEICKNTTIYTSQGKELQKEEENYIEEILTTLYEILGTVRKKINESAEKIEKIYITGTGALINNIDLYFQEYILDIDCEILKPYFITNTFEINIKEYIEVNSAISLALMGLGEGIEGLNFKKSTLKEQILDLIKIQTNSSKDNITKRNKSTIIKWDLGQKLDKTEISLVRLAVGIFLLVSIYSGFSVALGKSIQKKADEANNLISDTNKQIQLVKNDDEKIKSKINEYSTIIKNLEEINDKISERNKTRNAIPNLLNQIMAVIPVDVQITSIENTQNTHIVIEAKSKKYEQLGFLIAIMKNDVILTNVVSSAGQKDGEYITIKIEGDLP